MTCLLIRNHRKNHVFHLRWGNCENALRNGEYYPELLFHRLSHDLDGLNGDQSERLFEPFVCSA
ncbi:hypothetical protein predicted by Glimmer/Critica [Acetobacter senegalensis]|uniref:Uncharacterized protein n=1 Tax=Acetobacter senegalensis TaxID=446692 RepID=A0A0U5BC14_9PROT|nr:hypothetical protein predicted by Glimmer/Critica [Acetobacter senegalensis]